MSSVTSCPRLIVYAIEVLFPMKLNDNAMPQSNKLWRTHLARTLIFGPFVVRNRTT